MTSEVEPRLSSPNAEAARYEQYRALSISAVSSLVLGVLSVLALLEWVLAVIPLLGIVTGVVALAKIRRCEGELTGARLAKIGITLSAVLLISGWTWMSIEYAVEVPEGFQRITFRELQPHRETPGELPPEALELDGQQVFVKGYVFPGAQREGLTEFVLVPDRGTCCFGGQPKLTDMIYVKLQGDQQVDFSFYQRKLAGTFRVLAGRSADKVGSVIYHLDAEYVK